MKKSLLVFALAAVAWSFMFAFGFAPAHAQVVSPSVPSGINAFAGPLPGQASISWTASTEVSGTVEGYYIYRNAGLIASTTATSFVDTGGGYGLVSGVFGYAIAAYDQNGNVSPESVPFDVVVTADTTPPSVPAGLTISGVTTTNSYYASTTLTIAWNASTDNVSVAGYKVYRNGTMITPSTSTYTGTSITDSVVPGSYSYQVDAYDGSGNISGLSAPATIAVVADLTPPTTPTKLAAQQTGASGVTLTWASSSDNIAVAGYQVFRNGIQIASTTVPSFVDGGLSVDVPYTYVVTAYDGVGNISNQSGPVTESIQETNGPGTPVIVGDTLVGTSSAQLSWSIANDVLVLTGYTLYRDGTSMATVTSTSYLDTGLAPGLHTYSVDATDISGAISSMSATSTITIPTPGSTAQTSVASTTTSVPVVSSVGTASPAGTTFTQSLYYGLRSTQVTALQSLLAANGYMSSVYATGFFGSITLKAVKTFQCDHGIVCSGAGWGNVGPKTREALNGLGGSATSTSGSTTSMVVTSASTQSVAAEIQALQAQLANLEKQL